MSLPYVNFAGLRFPAEISIVINCLTGFVIVCIFASIFFFIFYVSTLLRTTYRSYKLRLRRGNATATAITNISDHYAMLVKYTLLLIVCIMEFFVFLSILFERAVILLYVDLKNISHVNVTCALDRITPHFYNNFPITGILVSLSSVVSLFFLLFTIILLKYLLQYYTSKCRDVRFRFYRVIIASLFTIALLSLMFLYLYTFFVGYPILLLADILAYLYIIYLLTKIYKTLKIQTIILRENTYDGEDDKYVRQFKMLKTFKRLSIFVYGVFCLFIYSEVMGHFTVLYKLVIYQLCQKSRVLVITPQLFDFLQITFNLMEYSVLFAFLIASLSLIIPYFMYAVIFKLCIPLKTRLFGSGRSYRFTPQYHSKDLVTDLIDK